MEILLALEPVATGIMAFTASVGVLGIIGVIGVSVIRAVSRVTRDNDTATYATAILKTLRPVAVICLGISLLLLPATYSWDIYKNVLIYRAINSDTTEHVIENTNTLLEKLGKVIEEVDPKKVVGEIRGGMEKQIQETLEQAANAPANNTGGESRRQ